MPRIESKYQRPWWLPTGHLKSIWAYWLPRRKIEYRRERVELHDGDFVDFDWSETNGQDDKPILCLFHGLEGNSNSHYALNTMHAANTRGWTGVVAHFRGCSGEPNRLARSYHSGDSEHIDHCLRFIKQRFPERALFAAGISLGGNALTKWCGEEGDDAKEIIVAAASASSPLDLGISAQAILHGHNWLFNKYFMVSMGESYAKRMELHPELRKHAYLSKPKNFPQFDEHYTAPMHGYTSAWDYYLRASSRGFVAKIRIPFLLLNAMNDPFVPASLFPLEHEVPDNITLEQPDDGGHVGFVAGRFPGHMDWLSERFCEYFEAILGAHRG
jgi:uncharacterized protein